MIDLLIDLTVIGWVIGLVIDLLINSTVILSAVSFSFLNSLLIALFMPYIVL
jgi:hypothetical protein